MDAQTIIMIVNKYVSQLMDVVKKQEIVQAVVEEMTDIDGDDIKDGDSAEMLNSGMTEKITESLKERLLSAVSAHLSKLVMPLLKEL